MAGAYWFTLGRIVWLTHLTLHFPSCWRLWRRFFVAALALAPGSALLFLRERRGSPSSPARCGRPALWRGTGLRTPLMRFRFLPSAFAGRAVPPESDHASGPSRFGILQPSAPMPRRLVRPCGFYRLAFPMRSLCLLETPSARVIRDRLTIGARTGPGLGLFSRPGRAFFSKPGNARGIWLRSSQFCSGSRVGAFFNVSNPPAVWPFARREFHRRGVFRPGGIWLRLLGFGPANEPCRAIRRSR